MSEQELYLEYSRLLKDDIFGVNPYSPIYKKKNEDFITEYKIDKKGKHIIYSYNKNKSITNTIKTWYNNGDYYKKIHNYKRYDEETKEYFKNGLRHRENKPAYLYETYKYRPIITQEKWYKDGMLHNEDGPASILIEDETDEINNPYYYSQNDYFLNNEYYKKEKYDEHIKKIKTQKLCDKLYEYNVSCKDVCNMISSYVY